MSYHVSCSIGTGSSFPWVKRSGCEGDHSLPKNVSCTGQSSVDIRPKKLSMHDSVALSGKLEAREAEEEIMLDAIIPLYRTTNTAVTPTPIYLISRISCPDVPLNSCQQVDCGLPRSSVSTHTGVKGDCVVASTYGCIGWSNVATPSPDRNSPYAASKHTHTAIYLERQEIE